MADETTVGGIVGFMRLDADQFNREIDKAIAKVEILDGKNVDVKVNTSGVERVTRAARPAAAGLDQVAAASRRVADATGRVEVAQVRLDQARSRGNPTAVASAELSLARALRDQQDAAFGTYESNLKVGESNDRIDRSARRASGSVGGLGRSFGGRGLFSAPVIIGALVAAVALLGPVTAAATAGAAGLVGVIGAGTLAFKGFQNEIKNGTTLGNTLQGQLDGLAGRFRVLEATAASASAPGVFAGLRTLDSFLPTLNDNVYTLGASLGHAFSLSAGGIVTGLKNMMPLLEDGGRWAEVLAQKFADFTASQDFKDFIAYAQRELPEVAQAIGDLVSGVVDLGVALAPVGEAMIKVLGLAGKVASGVGQFGEFANRSGVKNVMEWTSGLGLAAKAYGWFTDDAKSATEAVKAHGAATQAAMADVAEFTPAQEGMAAALGTTTAALKAAEDAQAGTASKTAATTRQMQMQNDAAGLLKQSLDALNGKTLDVASAQTTAASATLRVTEALTKNGDTLSLNTQKGVANRQAIEAKVRADQAAAEAIAKSTGSTEAGTKALAGSKAALEKSLRAQGLLTDKVQAYIDKLYKVPKKVPPTKLDVDKKQADAALDALARHLSVVTQDRTVTVTTNMVTIGSGRFAGKKVPGSADGGTVGGSGGPRADDQLTWLSTGEEVINAASASKHRALLKAINADKFADGGTVGGYVQHFASGGTVRKKSDPLASLRSQYGRYLATDAVGALIGVPDAVLSDAVQRINTSFDKVSKITAALAKSHKASAAALTRDAAVAEKALSRLAVKREAVVDQLASATDRLKSVQDEYDSYAAGVAKSAGAKGALDALFFGKDDDGGDVVNTWQAVSMQMEQAAKDTAAFQAQIDQLSNAGLSKSLIEQIVGSDRGATIASSILAGGGDAIEQLNRSAADLAQASAGLGKRAADSVYGSAVAAAQGEVDELKAREADLVAQMTAIGTAMRDGLRAGLAGKSVKGAQAAINAALKKVTATAPRSALATVSLPKVAVQAGGSQAAGQPISLSVTVPNPLTGEDVTYLVRGEVGKALSATVQDTTIRSRGAAVSGAW